MPRNSLILQFINYLTNLDRSNYDGLQATLTARNYHNLSVVAGYTYAHALDDVSHNFGTVVPQDSTNPNGSYGASDFDIRHRFTLSVTYDMPGKNRRRNCWKVGSSTRLSRCRQPAVGCCRYRG